MQDLRRKWNRTAATTQQLEDDDQTLQLEIDLSLKEIQQRRNAIEQVKLNIQETNEENQQLLAKANATAVETFSRRSRMQALKGQVTQLKALYAQKQSAKIQLEQQVTELESSKKIRSCTNISEALQTKAILNENQIREQQEVNAQLEAKHKQMEEKIRLAGTTKQQLQEQLLQLQMEELQQKHEEIQAKTKNLEAKSALQKAEGEEGQLNSETGLLEQEFQLAKERDQHIETLVDILSQNVTQAIGTKNTLIDLKNYHAGRVTSLTQNLNNTVDMINDLSHENKQLREKKDQINTAGQSLQETKQHLEQKRTALTTQRAELSASVDQVTREKEQLLLSIETLNIDMDQIEFNLRKGPVLSLSFPTLIFFIYFSYARSFSGGSGLLSSSVFTP
ncbi:hypothetical protein C7M84_000848 [Penaeus vannamei]|uniref:Uncharacterized protein n=1 Tax=Penaeus vannamei TaxID=6689 RepID=A0A423TVF6_PENVA|nr:hypothetical protein C7M84_000848 [Penaeus vannamei]